MPYIVTYQTSDMPEPLRCHPPTFTFDTGAEAAAARAAIALQMPHTVYRVKQIADPEAMPWRDREQMRFDHGTYTRTPWHDEPWYQKMHGELFAHMSRKQPGMVSFTEDAAKGEADRQAPATSPGRFLQRFFALSASDVEAWAAKAGCVADGEVVITQDADEIEAVYQGGPGSCMTFEDDDYSGPVHPCRVYAGPDLALAYTGPKHEATARCIVWPEKKLYGRVYPESNRIGAALEAMGYTSSSGVAYGARIQRIEADYGFVMPYVDGTGGAHDDGEYLILGSGYICTDETSGVSERNGPHCDRCGDIMCDDESNWIGGTDQNVCDHCYGNHYLRCDYSGESDRADRIHEVHGHPTYSYVHQDNMGKVDCYLVEDMGGYHYIDNIFTCDDCGNVFHIDDAHNHSFQDIEGEEVVLDDDVRLCGGCLEDRNYALDQRAHVLTRNTARDAWLTALQTLEYDHARSQQPTVTSMRDTLVGTPPQFRYGEEVFRRVLRQGAGDAAGCLWEPLRADREGIRKALELADPYGTGGYSVHDVLADAITRR